MSKTVKTAKLPVKEVGRITEIFTRLRAANPNPETELQYGNAFQLLVAVVLSAQATDKGVNKATAALFTQIKTPQEMVALGEEGLREFIKTIGLYKAKAKNVIALSEQLVREHDGQVPKTRPELVALPGVGPKTAAVIMNVLYGEPTLAVDTHVFRVAHRLGLSTGSTPDKVEAELVGRIPGEFLTHAHHWLILHGRYTCVARTPKCDTCMLTDLCPWFKVQRRSAG